MPKSLASGGKLHKYILSKPGACLAKLLPDKSTLKEPSQRNLFFCPNNGLAGMFGEWAAIKPDESHEYIRTI
jgi:hypothetical protein